MQRRDGRAPALHKRDAQKGRAAADGTPGAGTEGQRQDTGRKEARTAAGALWPLDRHRAHADRPDCRGRGPRARRGRNCHDGRKGSKGRRAYHSNIYRDRLYRYGLRQGIPARQAGARRRGRPRTACSARPAEGISCSRQVHQGARPVPLRRLPEGNGRNAERRGAAEEGSAQGQRPPQARRAAYAHPDEHDGRRVQRNRAHQARDKLGLPGDCRDRPRRVSGVP